MAAEERPAVANAHCPRAIRHAAEARRPSSASARGIRPRLASGLWRAGRRPLGPELHQFDGGGTRTYPSAMKLAITTHAEQAKQDRAYWRSCTPEERLDAVELLRLEAGKFLYEYPSRLRRTVTITRRAGR
jgi:hypothetical protein